MKKLLLFIFLISGIAKAQIVSCNIDSTFNLNRQLNGCRYFNAPLGVIGLPLPGYSFVVASKYRPVVGQNYAANVHLGMYVDTSYGIALGNFDGQFGNKTSFQLSDKKQKIIMANIIGSSLLIGGVNGDFGVTQLGSTSISGGHLTGIDIEDSLLYMAINFTAMKGFNFYSGSSFPDTVVIDSLGIRISKLNTLNGLAKFDATGRISSTAAYSTVGLNFLTLTNPSAVTYVRINADNSLSTRTAPQMLSDLGATSGTVTSVDLTVPPQMTVTGNPITTSGTMTLSFASQSPNLVFSSKDGLSGAPLFRSLVAADIPSLAYYNSGDTVSTLATQSFVLLKNYLISNQTITLSGDVAGSGATSIATTISNGAVSLSKMANMATASLIYRKTAGTGAPEVNSLATLKTDLLLTGTNSGDATLSGENYLFLSGQAFTANAVNVSGSNITGIMAGTNGGTGVNNASRTMTYAGNVNFSGAFNPTFVSSATATDTLPTATTRLLANNIGITGNTTLIGSTGTNGTLSLQTTSGVGASGADMIFKVGNNGGTEAMRILNSGFVGIGINAPTGFLHVVGTLASGSVNGSTYTITTAGSSGSQNGIAATLSAGYTGSTQANCLSFNNNVAGTGASNQMDGNYSGNHGAIGFSGATTVGTNVGLLAYARKGNINIGVLGMCDDVKSGATQIGVAGVAFDPGGGGLYCGLVGRLQTGNTAVTVAACAILADNGAATLPIMLWRDNGTVVATMADGGNTFWGGTTSPTARVHIAAQTASASTAPIKLVTGTVNTTAEAGAMEYSTPALYFTNGGAQRQELIQSQQTRVSTQYDKTDSTVANVTGLTTTLVAGKTYSFEAILHVTADATGGSKFTMSGTCTATNIIYEVIMVDNASNANTITSRKTALNLTVGQSGTTSGCCKINGMITVNGAGTITCQMAQNAILGTSSVLVGSYFKVSEIQ